MYVGKNELNNYYKQLYGKDFPSSTLSKWKKDNRVKTIINPKNKSQFLYDFEDFQEIVTSQSYINKLRAPKENPQNYIGQKRGNLLIVGVVPKEEKQTPNYIGTLMYCKCLKCNRPDLVQIRFSYLTPNGNYNRYSCGCDRKERAFLATSREGIKEEFIDKFEDFDYYLFVHKFLTSTTENYYIKCDISEYEKAIEFFYYDKQLKKIYEFWEAQNKDTTTFYDWCKPSLDHIIPKSRGGTNKLNNLQALTVFENFAKRDMTWEEWQNFKQRTNTKSDYYLENILQK